MVFLYSTGGHTPFMRLKVCLPYTLFCAPKNIPPQYTTFYVNLYHI